MSTSDSWAAVLVDFDNFFPDALGSREEMQQAIGRMIDCVLERRPTITDIAVRFYGGWHEDGILTKRASELLSLVGARTSSTSHPIQTGVLRASVELATHLAAVPGLLWAHTVRSRRGLPRLRIAETPRPDGCVSGDACPIDLVQRMSRRSGRQCHVDGCEVDNHTAFLIREQKLVDTLLSCDCMTYAEYASLVLVLSDDLDVLPGVVLAASAVRAPAEIALVRRNAASEGIYDPVLSSLGISRIDWESA